MIDFRYHLVSIVAVFLALAVGIIVGAQAIAPDVVSGLKAESQLQKKTNERLRADNTALAAQLNTDDLFAQTVSAALLSHLLQGEHVVLVTAPGYDGRTVTGLTAALRQAGATVTGQVNLTAQFLDVSESTESGLNALAQRLAPPGTSLSAAAAAGQISGQQAAAQVIAAAIVDSGGQAALTSQQRQAILAGFGAGGFLQVNGPGGAPVLAGPATLAVLVIPATPALPVNASSPVNLAIVEFGHQLDRASDGALLAGSLPGSGTGSAIDAVTSGAAGVAITTVDNASTSTGQIMVVEALRLMLDPHPTPAAYGVSSNTVPSPAPSTAPSVSPSPTATGSVGKHGKHRVRS